MDTDVFVVRLREEADNSSVLCPFRALFLALLEALAYGQSKKPEPSIADCPILQILSI